MRTVETIEAELEIVHRLLGINPEALKGIRASLIEQLEQVQPIDQEAKARFLTYLSPKPDWAEAIWTRLYPAHVAYVPAGKRVAYYRLA